MSAPLRPQTWVAHGNGQLAIRGRPSLRLIPRLPDHGCSRVVTLLSDAEGAPELGRAVRRAGMEWTWIPLRNGRPPEGSVSVTAREGVLAVSAAILGGESVLIHCAAGFHRTGMLTWAILRRHLAVDASRDALAALRPETLAAMSQEHFDWGEGLEGMAT